MKGKEIVLDTKDIDNRHRGKDKDRAKAHGYNVWSKTATAKALSLT